MTRVAILRAGYAGLGVALGTLAASAYVGSLLIPSLVLSLIAGLLLAFSDDEIPKWAGLALVAYFLVFVLAFALASSVTVRTGDRFHIESPSPELAAEVQFYVGLLFPLAVAGVTLAAAWERERVVRGLLVGAVAGLVLTAILAVVLVPQSAEMSDVARAQLQSRLVQAFGALCGLVAAGGAFWSAARPEEYA